MPGDSNSPLKSIVECKFSPEGKRYPAQSSEAPFVILADKGRGSVGAIFSFVISVEAKLSLDLKMVVSLSVAGTMLWNSYTRPVMKSGGLVVGTLLLTTKLRPDVSASSQMT